MSFAAACSLGTPRRRLLEALLTPCRDCKLLRARGQQRTAATPVLGAIRVLHRLACVGEALRHALTSLAVVAPAWLRDLVPADWVDRYAARMAGYRLPSSQADQQALALTSGADG